jgi:hypothetical protein
MARHAESRKRRNPDILILGVDCLHVHSHGSEGHIVERNIGRIGYILYGGHWHLPSFADSCRVYCQPKYML